MPVVGGVVVMDGGAGVVLVTPGVEEVVVGDGDDESDQQGLGDAAVGEPGATSPAR